MTTFCNAVYNTATTLRSGSVSPKCENGIWIPIYSIPQRKQPSNFSSRRTGQSVTLRCVARGGNRALRRVIRVATLWMAAVRCLKTIVQSLTDLQTFRNLHWRSLGSRPYHWCTRCRRTRCESDSCCKSVTASGVCFDRTRDRHYAILLTYTVRRAGVNSVGWTREKHRITQSRPDAAYVHFWLPVCS